jgi:hypothetical protein
LGKLNYVNQAKIRMKRIIVFGPGPQFKGGIANFTLSLAKSLEQQGAQVDLVSWTQ